MKRLLSLAVGDLRNITRDPLLLMTVTLPILIGVVFRFGIPLAEQALLDSFGLRLEPYYPLVMSFLLLIPPLLVGILAGFMLLDERDEGILQYFAITPLTKGGFLVYRLTIPVVFSATATLFLLWFVNLGPVNLGAILPVILMASLEAPMVALFLGVFAGNKVEGFALSKVLGIAQAAPVVGFVVNSHWRFIAGLVPTFWVSMTYTSVNSHSYGIYLALGLIVHILYTALLWTKFQIKTR